jgi:glycosyltransferase involved in cell wall biosynthesis
VRIWIFNHHALTPEQGGGTRHYDYARQLIARGYDVTIFASSFHYATNREFKVYPDGGDYLRENCDGVDFVWIRTRPYRGNSIGRVVNMIDYMLKAERIAKKEIEERPDIVIGSSVHLFAVLAAYRCAGHYRVPFVMEVRDLWPRTLIDMGMWKWHPFILLLGWLERFLYRRADAVITNLPYASEYISKYVPEEKIHWLANGVDLSRNSGIAPYRFEEGRFHVLYAGAIGKANQIETLIHAAEKLKNEKIDIHILGEGPERERLEAYVEAAGLKHVFFHGAVDKQQAISMINGADLLYFPLADSPVFRYGIASNKLFDYLAAGRPVLFASNAANNPIEEAGAGISVPAEDPGAVAEAVLKVFNMPPEQREGLGRNGYEYVRRHYDMRKLAAEFEKVLSSIGYNSENS